MATFGEGRLSQLLPGVASPSEIYYRIIETKFVKTIDEIGPSMMYGGRYNPRGEFGVLYLSINAECAFLEKLRQYFGNEEAIPPQSAAHFRVHLRQCLDLTDAGVLERLQITRDMLIDPTDYTFTQNLSQSARASGFEALIAPAVTRENCKTLVVYKDKLAPPSYCIFDVNSLRPFRS